MGNRVSPRIWYIVSFLALLLTEVLIALFVRDQFLRPYGGDILVTVLLCCFVRCFFPTGIRLLPVWVFLFAAAVEAGQAFDIVSRLGLGESAFFRILVGSVFSPADLICYGIGCGAFFLGEQALRHQS